MKLVCPLFFVLALSADAADFDLAAKATNQLGVDLYHQLAAGDTNLCLSPYSIETALAMTFAGAEGDTRTQMARVLHFPTDADAPHASFAALQSSLGEMSKKPRKSPSNLKIGAARANQSRFRSRTACSRKAATTSGNRSSIW